MKKEETRIELVKAATPREQWVHMKDADLIIWACGYQTNKIPIRDFDGKEIMLS